MMKWIFPFFYPKRLAILLVGLMLAGIFIQWRNAPIGVQVFDLLVNPMIHKESVDHYARRYGEDPLFITAVMKVESNFSKKAKSARGAIGLMQIMPNTALEMAKELDVKDFKPEDLKEPDTNIMLGTYYISKLRKEFDADNILLDLMTQQ